MLRRKDPYTSAEIAQQVTNLERLHKLRDMCVQKIVIAENAKADSIADHYSAESDRYCRNIESAQKLLDYMQNRNAGTKK